MAPREPKLSVADRKRRQRERLRDAGLKAVEVWVKPEHRPILRRLEHMLRLGIVPELTPAAVVTEGKEVVEMDLDTMQATLNGLTSENGFRFTTGADDADSIEVVVEDREEFPVIVTRDEEQILCLIYLWDDAQVKADKRLDLLTLMLEMNVPLPLSSFGKVGDRFVIFGALAAGASLDDVITELEVLSDNALEAVEAVSSYLN